MNLHDWATYIAAAGLLGLSVYQVSQGDFAHATQSFFAALAALGIGKGISDNKAELKKLKGMMCERTKV